MRHRVAVLAGVLCLCGVRMAHAESKIPGPFALDTELQLGWVQGQHSGGLDAGLTARLRYDFLAAGVSAQGATLLLGSMTSASAVAGVSIPIAFVRFDVLAELGFNAYSSVGANLLGDDPGASGTLPFAGGRAAVLARLFRSKAGTSIWLGPAVQYAKDLHSTTVTYTYRNQGQNWFGGDEYDYLETDTARLGQSRVSLLLTLSARFPL